MGRSHRTAYDMRGPKEDMLAMEELLREDATPPACGVKTAV